MNAITPPTATASRQMMRRRRSSARCSVNVMRSWTVGRGFSPRRRSLTTSGRGLARGRLLPRDVGCGRGAGSGTAVGLAGVSGADASFDGVVLDCGAGGGVGVSMGSLRASRSSASNPEVILLISFVALPSLRIASGSFSGPSTSSATTAMTSSSVAEMLNTTEVYGAAPSARLRLPSRRPTPSRVRVQVR